MATAEPGRAAEQILVAAAAESWPEMLRSAAIQSLADTAERALGEPDGLAVRASEESVSLLVEQARDRAIAQGDGGLLVALAERSLARVLLERVARQAQPAGLDPAVVPAERAGGASLFFSETIRQLLLHLAARDLPGVDLALTARAARERTRLIAAAGVDAVQPASDLLRDRGSPAWTDAVDRVFRPPRPLTSL